MAKKIVTPKGTAEWIYVFTPDTKFNAEGDYKVNLKIPADKATALCKQLDKLVDDMFDRIVEEQPKIKTKIIKNAPYEADTDDQGNETGDLVFKFKQKAAIHSKKTGKTYEVKPKVFDAKGQPITTAINLGNGSVVKVAFEPSPYFVPSSKAVGVTLRNFDIQVIELVEYGASNSVFGEEEGFEYDEEDNAVQDTDFTSEEEDDSEEDDF